MDEIAGLRLTMAQKSAILDGYIGDQVMVTVNALKRKGLFHLVIDSPNGRCGFMRLTPLGIEVQAILRARAAS